MSEKTGTTTASVMCPLSDAVLKQLAWLDLAVPHRFMTGSDTAPPRETTRNLSLEYRRFLLLRMAYPEDCEALTRGTSASPDELVPPLRPPEQAADPEIRELYEITFPYGKAELWAGPRLILATAPAHPR